MSQHMQIAKTILEQLRAGEVYGNRRGSYAMACWAAREFIAMSETEDSRGGLRFRVSGAKHKGYVCIKLAGNDTYTVELAHIYAHQWKVDKTMNGIYFDDLASIIDCEVEAGADERR